MVWKKNIIYRVIVWLRDIILIYASIRHVYGPKKIKCGKNDVIAVSQVRDGELYIRDFISHYFSLGVKHIVFLDNGSRDNTVRIASGYDNVTIFSSNYPTAAHPHNENIFRQFLAYRFCKKRWCILADIDEFFDYPFSDVVSLASLTEYLSAYSYNAVIAQTLDMFSDKSLAQLRGANNIPIRELCRYYDVSKIQSANYFNIFVNKTNSLANEKIKWYIGGIRKTIFGTDHWLTKHPMFFLDGRLIPASHAHGVSRGHCADFTAILYHYKFISDFYERAMQYASDRFAVPEHYDAIIAKFKNNPDSYIKQETARELKSVNDLVGNGFLLVSKSYLEWANRYRK